MRPMSDVRTLAGLVLAATAAVAACSAEAGIDDLEIREGIAYAAESETPFSGMVTRPFPDSVQAAPGVVAAMTEYVNGVPEGTHLEFHPDGSPRVRAHYAGGKLEGPRVVMDPSGQVLREETYDDGKLAGTVRTFFPDGSLESEGEYLNGALHGTLRRWYPNGRMRLEREYRNGYPHGITKEWYENGQIMVDGAYLDGHVNGPYRRWHANGQLALDGVYFRGESLEIRMWDEAGNELDVQPDIAPADTVGDAWRVRSR